MVTPKDVLVRAYDLLGEYGICRGAYGIDGNGYAVPSFDPNAKAFCSVGAVTRAVIDLCGTYEPQLAWECHALLQPDMQVIGWNDSSTDEEILATFRKAAGLPEPTKPVDELTEASESILVAA